MSNKVFSFLILSLISYVYCKENLFDQYEINKYDNIKWSNEDNIKWKNSIIEKAAFRVKSIKNVINQNKKFILNQALIERYGLPEYDNRYTTDEFNATVEKLPGYYNESTKDEFYQFIKTYN